jgi:hypothetical protein
VSFLGLSPRLGEWEREILLCMLTLSSLQVSDRPGGSTLVEL